MKVKPLVGALVAVGLAGHALAQDSTQRIEITGSSIKRIAAEGALPVQVIRAEQLQTQGITSVEQLVATISAMGNGQDNMVSNQGGDFLNSLFLSGRAANNGSSAASLRGLGPQNTLVLLNGRRVSPHGLSGKSVDLNSIPFDAIDRIEILKDGASAIYGADAIGGVMNFILRRDFQGLRAGAGADVTEAGGGNIFRGSLTFGAGNLDSDGFNVIAAISVEKQERLRGSQRDFHTGFQPARGLAPDTTGTAFATINAASGTALPASFTLPGSSQSYNRFNPLALPGAAGCTSIANTYPYQGQITGFLNNNLACAYDYGKDWSLQQPVEGLNFVARASLKFAANHTGFAEITGSSKTSNNEYTPNQITTVARGANYPRWLQRFNPTTGAMEPVLDANGARIPAPYYQDLTGVIPGYNNTAPIRLRWRCVECGTRQQETEADTYRLLVGAEGTLDEFDYKLGLSTAGSKGETTYLNGYLKEVEFRRAMETGLINPFLRPGQQQTPEALALIESTQYRGGLYDGEAKLVQLDGNVSRPLFKLPGGTLSGALGLELRKESFQFNDGTAGLPAIIGAGSPARLDKAERDIKAVYAELDVPVTTTLAGQLAVRHDRYSDFGSTTNPKIALRWQPNKLFLLRGSYNTGFHAPDFGPLYEGQNTGQFTSDINDPVFCARFPGDPRYCNIRPTVFTGGNPNLKPEKSKQWSLGFVVEPTEWLSASLDLFRIRLEDRLSVRTGQEIIDNAAALGEFIVRDAPDPIGDGDPTTIDFVRAGWVNVAGDEVTGADLNIKVGFNTAFGRITGELDGTYLDQYKTRKSSAEPWVNRVGQFGDFDYLWDLKLRWKHTLSATWSNGPWSATVLQRYSSGYASEYDGYGSGVILQDLGFQKRISSYTLYNASVSWTGVKNLKLTFGIKNLFDQDPPFSNHNVDNVAGAGWDARVGDPRGRSFTLRADYTFW